MTEPIDLTAIREEIEAIKREAIAYGYNLAGDKLSELREEIAKIRGERAGKPPCYQRMYDQSAPHCRVCDLRHDCSGQHVPAYVPMDELRPEPCTACEIGTLTVELLDVATEDVRDYGCTTTGCTNTLLQQSQMPEEKLPKAPKRKPVKQAKGKALEKKILATIKRDKPRTRAQIYAAVAGAQPLAKKALDSLIASGRVIRGNQHFEVVTNADS